jgi:AcrR family transcriptional regulator
MRELAARLRLSPQTLYNYFPSKEALLTAIFAQRMRGMAAAAERLRVEFLAADGAEADPTERFLELVRWGLRGLAEDRDFMRVVYLHALAVRGGAWAGPDSRADEALQAEQEANDAVLARIFEDMQESGVLRSEIEPRELTELYVLVFSDRVARWLASESNDVAELERRVIGGLEILFRGARTREGREP